MEVQINVTLLCLIEIVSDEDDIRGKKKEKGKNNRKISLTLLEYFSLTLIRLQKQWDRKCYFFESMEKRSSYPINHTPTHTRWGQSW